MILFGMIDFINVIILGPKFGNVSFFDVLWCVIQCILMLIDLVEALGGCMKRGMLILLETTSKFSLSPETLELVVKLTRLF